MTNRNSAAITGAAPPPDHFSEAFELCVRKTRSNIKRLADEPRSAPWAVDGNYFAHPEEFFAIGNWTSSFFTGMALLAWRETADEYFLNQVQRLAPHYREKVFLRHLDTHHDLGFLAVLYSVALYKMTGGSEHREVGLRAAEVLSQRFHEQGNFLRAWGRVDESRSPIEGGLQTDNLAIIDGLMNLPLLYWAARETGHPRYYELAVRHAEMALRCFVRPDGSVAHAMRFNLETGQPLAADNYCGFSKDSYWARGAAWAIYGFALSYKHTRDEKYLSASVRLAKQFLAELDQEWVPVWDFRLPPQAEPVRDASAAAVLVCGLQELAVHHAADAALGHAKNCLLERICRADYLDSDPACPGILRSGYGNQVGFSSWGDYFLMEALAREVFQAEPWW